MAVLVTMPRMSQTTEEVTLLKWKVKVGDRVERGDPLCEVETDKTTMDVESFEAGTVLELRAAEDQAVAAGSVIAVLGSPGEAPSPSAAPCPSREETDDIRATPLVRNIARKHGVDLSRVRGTGAGGLITRGDVEAHITRSTGGAASGSAPVPASLTEQQRIVGRNLSRWWATAPHFYLRMTIGMDRLLERRRSLQSPGGASPSLNAFFIYAVARCLANHPRVNSCLRGEELVARDVVNVALAVTSGGDLYVPVVQNADTLGLRALDRETARLVQSVRQGSLRAADAGGATFTVTNLGMYGIDEFSPVIGPGQTAILAVGRIRRSLEVGEGDAIRIRSVCALTAAFDHRVVNGAEAAEFMSSVRSRIEEWSDGEDA